MLKSGLCIVLVSISASASASTPAAWAKLEQEVTRKCIEASTYRRPRVSNPLVFDDRNANVALLVSGIYPQSHMKGATGTSLCLFDRRTRTASVEEALSWSAGRR